ncbi:polygalacturonase QRT3 [Ananas comosus]|uniref:Polygalacturonase QRT3 n=1 Tax=Ananas comosus TaxID=4615 RepID=A0A6P5GTW6_ANACO|nr:polygalacturonase QRT3 [Ananas comosus]
MRLSGEQHYQRFLRSASARKSSTKKSRMFNLIEYGADPSGTLDSSEAILKAVEDAFKVQSASGMLWGVNNLGGVVIDLHGGYYKIGKPIRFPSGGGNLVFQGGTIKASDNFPSTGYLVELHSPQSSHRLSRHNSHSANRTAVHASNLGIYYEDITFRDVLFDANFRGGGLLVVDSARTRVTNCFFTHFLTDGILVEGGHETFVSDCFLGQHLTVGGDPRERNFSGTAINLASNDNAVTDVAIFSAAVGVLLRGQANILTGVHCYNKATYWGGVGILVRLPGSSQTRLDNCYMDYTGIVLEDPFQVIITNAFFLGDAYITLKSIKGEISGLNIVDNTFTGSSNSPIVKLDHSEKPFTHIDQVVVDRNSVRGMALKSTVGRLTVAGKGSQWTADFSGLLVFPDRITHVQYALHSRDRRSIPVHALTGVANNKVVVEATGVVDAVVSVAVDQYLMPGEVNHF